MKKLFLLASLMVGMLAIRASADSAGINVFRDGVQTSTITLSTTTCFIPGPALICGISMSTNPAGLSSLPFVSFSEVGYSTFTNLYTSTSAAVEKFRVYADTQTNGTGALSTTFREYMYPKYSARGWLVNASVNTYNLISIYYFKPSTNNEPY